MQNRLSTSLGLSSCGTQFLCFWIYPVAFKCFEMTAWVTPKDSASSCCVWQQSLSSNASSYSSSNFFCCPGCSSSSNIFIVELFYFWVTFLTNSFEHVVWGSLSSNARAHRNLECPGHWKDFWMCILFGVVTWLFIKIFSYTENSQYFLNQFSLCLETEWQTTKRAVDFVLEKRRRNFFSQIQILPVLNSPLTFRFRACVCCAVRSSSRAHDWIYILCFSLELIVVVCLWGGAFRNSHFPRIWQERTSVWGRYWKVYSHALILFFK